MNKKTRNIFLSILLLLSTQLFSQQYGRIVYIHDADTYKIKLIDNNETITVRLFGIDAPEVYRDKNNKLIPNKSQDYGIEATKFCITNYLNQLVQINLKHNDQYGRYVCELFIGTISINEILIANGYAWNYMRYSKSKNWENLQLNAKKTKIGLWSKPNPITPSEFRKTKKQY